MSKHLLWYSDTSKPDLGGHEDKDYRMYFQEEIENPEIVQKGFYRQYTVELDLSSLAVNTILQSQFLKDFEEASIMAATTAMTDSSDANKKGKQSKGQAQGAAGVDQGGDFGTDLDEFATCSEAFRKLKDLANQWL